ncbi:carbon-nitrogen hydrolase family protein [Endozoicomonas numazuensis]|uniref:Carbon-nitrogen hydrolase n=1 Tax=Endozoicomonas numazuensis TaxID=1137799 RepID=A0A081N6K6_9GAMM|nr:carbon-nitrogen hydrolase family protein [Endozoicomonas numazuensis]KEQ14079.1 carbon-nitrogen hydrolase [Endozoicomonas numazuensis]
MKISVAQLRVSYKDKQDNLQKLRQLLQQAPEVGDLVLLPELFSTGYIFEEAEEIVQLGEAVDNSSTLQALQLMAAEFNTILVAGFGEKEGGELYNSVAVVAASGLMGVYRKISSTNIDKRYFKRGQDLLVFEHQGIRFGIVICFDLWFPEIVREYVRQEVDILLHPANFGGEQSVHIARARAIENGLYVVTCNRIGEENIRGINGYYCGKSQVIDPVGKSLMSLGASEELKTLDMNINHKTVRTVLGIELESEVESILATANLRK